MRLGDESTCEEYQEEKNQLMSRKREISDMLKSYENADEQGQSFIVCKLYFLLYQIMSKITA